MHYRGRRNHFHLHQLYRHHSLQSCRQSCCNKTDSYMLANISVHLQHTGIQVFCNLYCIYMQSVPSRLAGQANPASSQLLAVRLLSSTHVPLGLLCLFLAPNIFSILTNIAWSMRVSQTKQSMPLILCLHIRCCLCFGSFSLSEAYLQLSMWMCIFLLHNMW